MFLLDRRPCSVGAEVVGTKVGMDGRPEVHCVATARDPSALQQHGAARNLRGMRREYRLYRDIAQRLERAFGAHAGIFQAQQCATEGSSQRWLMREVISCRPELAG